MRPFRALAIRTRSRSVPPGQAARTLPGPASPPAGPARPRTRPPNRVGRPSRPRPCPRPDGQRRTLGRTCTRTLSLAATTGPAVPANPAAARARWPPPRRRTLTLYPGSIGWQGSCSTRVPGVLVGRFRRAPVRRRTSHPDGGEMVPVAGVSGSVRVGWGSPRGASRRHPTIVPDYPEPPIGRRWPGGTGRVRSAKAVDRLVAPVVAYGLATPGFHALFAERRMPDHLARVRAPAARGDGRPRRRDHPRPRVVAAAGDPARRTVVAVQLCRALMPMIVSADDVAERPAPRSRTRRDIRRAALARILLPCDVHPDMTGSLVAG